jgi:Zn-dependent metalloprotease
MSRLASVLRLLAIAFAVAPVAAPRPAAARAPGAVSPEEWARQEALRPRRVAQAERRLDALRAELGLGAEDAFAATGSFTTGDGRTVVRLSQLHRGHRVFGAQAVARVLPDGTLRTTAPRLERGIALSGEPRLTAGQARDIALRSLGARGPLRGAPEVERVVFPARHLGGLASRLDAVSGRPVLDRRLTVTARLGEDHVWAYEVRTGVQRTAEGVRDLVFVVDGRTGAILDVRDLLQHAFTPIPSTGTGHGYYRGTVALATSRMADGSFALYDTTRGTLACPDLAGFTPDDSGWSATGMQVWYEAHDSAGVTDFSTWLFQSNPTNDWGDGFHFDPASFGDENGPNGQTAGVDAMSAMATTWDFYGRVFGRNGIDGLGTTVSALVLGNGWVDADNAWWTIGGKSAYLGIGSYPWNANGFRSMTDLDVVAHEMTHGVTSPSYEHAWVNSPEYEEAGLNEATSDFFSTMVRLWADRPAGSSGDSVPEGPAEWQIGMNVGHGTPIRWTDLPSRDGRSPDGWYDGLRYLDGHFSSGPLNRALYLLAHGASATPGERDHSVYLPVAFAGVGNDAAARIWYRAVTELLVPDGTGSLTYEDARAAALEAAAELYGAASPMVIAVENAFGAVNVGLGHGQPPHVKVWFAPWRNGDYVETSHFTDYSNREVFPKGETVRLRITVENTDDTRVTWATGGPSMNNGAIYWVGQGGVIHPDGSWTTPNQMGWHSITATSVADPRQLAEGRVFLINMDTDQDLEQDATDMAGIAFSWYLGNTVSPPHSVFLAPFVDDGDVSMFVDAMKSAWPVQ